jgi:hypothetical protein
LKSAVSANQSNGQREIILAGTNLPGAGNADIRRFYIAQQNITPLYPYRGQSIQAITGLFALQIDNIGESMLNLITILMSPVQSPQLNAALGITKALRQGIDALLGTDKESELVAGWEMRTVRAILLNLK